MRYYQQISVRYYLNISELLLANATTLIIAFIKYSYAKDISFSMYSCSIFNIKVKIKHIYKSAQTMQENLILNWKSTTFASLQTLLKPGLLNKNDRACMTNCQTLKELTLIWLLNMIRNKCCFNFLYIGEYDFKIRNHDADLFYHCIFTCIDLLNKGLWLGY